MSTGFDAMAAWLFQPRVEKCPEVQEMHGVKYPLEAAEKLRKVERGLAVTGRKAETEETF